MVHQRCFSRYDKSGRGLDTSVDRRTYCPFIYRLVTVVMTSSPPAREPIVFESLSIDGWPLLLLLSGIVGFAAFSWGVRGHFVADQTPAAMKMILALSLVGIAVFLFAIAETKAPDWRRAAGFCLHLLAIVLFSWAVLATRQKRPALAFAGKRPNHVFRQGPYAYIRHPFYTAYLLFWLGCAMATSSLVMLIMFAALVAVYTAAALGEERNFLRSAMRDEYEALRKSAGLFWPKLRLARRQL
jgi:protein-S-isoprenylcysteine O-methyltransferase Ste14